ncbi:DUF3426 domain-containing protein [Novilysobacter arseniciresistens]|uniref:DUF3426 domain-containing protein n=1 Tax=Novilysobacter arseniciresistens TaxID=1385522 RepID=UPI000A5176C5|nr:DUF3426 domain-containing protein [Lysobacter arseniciresistens]
MFVPCPHCGFLVASIVSRDGAPQRCPRCEGLLSPDVATEAESTPADVPDVTAAPAAPAPTAAIATAPASAKTRARSPAPAPGASRKPRRTAPTFARTVVPKPRTGRRWPTWLAIAGLGLLLVVQLLLSQRATLAASERWRPLIAATCSALMCELPPWREPLAFTMLARNVEQAGAPGVLAVTASFRNDARWPQPWPALRLSLSDVDGIPVAARVFQPDEYRGSGAAAEPLLAPGQSANVRFEVVEPTPEIVAFTFDFR